MRKTLLVLVILLSSVLGLFASSWSLHIQESFLNTGLGCSFKTDNMEYSVDVETACLNTVPSLINDEYGSSVSPGIKWLYALMAFNSIDTKFLYKAYECNNFEINVGGTILGSHYYLYGLDIPFSASSITLNGAAKVSYRFNRFSAFAQTRVPLLGISFNKNERLILQSLFSNTNLLKDIAYNINIGLSVRLGK